MGQRSILTDTAIINGWIDKSNAGLPRAIDDAARIMKLFEESGEAASAYIGFTGQNPRKGITHTRERFLDEIADVVITALCAMHHFSEDDLEVRRILVRKVDHIMVRAGLRGA